MPQEQTILPIGATVRVRDAYEDGYCVKELLGKGGFGAIYLVSERRDKKRVFALKEVVEPSKQDRKRLLFEFELLKRLNHPALPRVYHVFEKEYLPENTTTIFRYGTPGYAAIEQYSPESTTGIRTDVYGLGATLYREQ